ncbi:MAG: hypothetical protein Kow0092_05080 [Deferrisomatales bacterium]
MPEDADPMDSADDTLTQIERLYGRVLELTRDQEKCLRTGDLAALPALLAEKAAAVERAGRLMAAMKGAAGSSPDRAPSPAVARLGRVLGEIVALEERCAGLVPNASPRPPPRSALAAYARAGRGG